MAFFPLLLRFKLAYYLCYTRSRIPDCICLSRSDLHIIACTAICNDYEYLSTQDMPPLRSSRGGSRREPNLIWLDLRLGRQSLLSALKSSTPLRDYAVTLIERQLICDVRTSRLKHVKRIKPNRRYNVGKIRLDMVCREEMRVLERSSCSRRGFVRSRHREWGYQG